MSNFDRAFIKAYDKNAESTEPTRRASTRDVLLSISLRKEDGSTQRIEQPVEPPQTHVGGPHLDPISMATGQDVAMSNVELPASSVLVFPMAEMEPKSPSIDKHDAITSPNQATVETNEAIASSPSATSQPEAEIQPSRMNINLDHIRQIRDLEAERAQRAEARRLAEQAVAEQAEAERLAEERVVAAKAAAEQAAREQAEAKRLAEERIAAAKAAALAEQQRLEKIRAEEERISRERYERELQEHQARQRELERETRERLEQLKAEQEKAEQLLAGQDASIVVEPFTTYVESVTRAEAPAAEPVETSIAPEPLGVHAPTLEAHSIAAAAAEPSSKAAASKFEPAWEVDAIAWPAISDLLLQTQIDYFAEAGDQLRDSAAEGLSVLAVSSELRGEGRSTVAVSLARSAAAAGIRVALLDADFDNPSLGGQLGLSEAPGWDEVLDGRTPLSEAAVLSLQDNVCVFPLSLDAAATELAPSNSAVTALVRRVAQEFDLVIIDAGPLGASDRVLFESGERCPVDAAIMVRDVRRSEAADQQHNLRLWRAIGVNAVGAVENFLPN